MSVESVKLSEFARFVRKLEDKTRGGEMRTLWPGEYPTDLAMKPEQAWLCLMLLDEIKSKTQDVKIPPCDAPDSLDAMAIDVSMDEVVAVIDRIAVLAKQRDASIASAGALAVKLGTSVEMVAACALLKEIAGRFFITVQIARPPRTTGSTSPHAKTQKALDHDVPAGVDGVNREDDEHDEHDEYDTSDEDQYKGDWWREIDTPNEALRGYPAIRQDWESAPTAWPSWNEAGEYDGETFDEGDEVYSLHLSIADCKAFIKEVKERGLAIGKPRGSMLNVLVDKATHEKIKASKHGIIVGDEDAEDELKDGDMK
ncbi:MAG: hypothetical protein Q6373_018490 [Candidatus Sigynarchaeota archaeon]